MVLRSIPDLDLQYGRSAIATCILEPAGQAVLYANPCLQNLVKDFQIKRDVNLLTNDSRLGTAVIACLQQQQFQLLERADWGYRFELLPVEFSGAGRDSLHAVQCQIIPLPAQAEMTSDSEPGELGFKRILEYFPHSSWVCSLNGEVFWTNRTSNMLAYGREVVVDLANTEYVRKIHPEDLPFMSTTFSRAMVEERFEPFRFRMLDHHGKFSWFLFTAAPVRNDDHSVRYWTGASIDIDAFVQTETGLKRQIAELDEQVAALRQKLTNANELVSNVQKIELVTHLAAGVAHDLNNMLFVMDINLQKLQRSVSEQSQLDSIRMVRDSVTKASRLSSQLSGFSGRLPQNATIFNPGQTVSEFHELLVQAAGAEIRLIVAIDNDIHNVRADKTYLENALINLVINARDAMNGSGTIRLTLRNHMLETENGRQAHVLFEITDTGSGMPPEIRQRIFEPFYTTKEPGKGTGLGLPMVKNFVDSSDGRIEVVTAAGEGTSIRIFLPKSESQAPILTTSQPMATGGREVIMLIEDDKEVRQSVGNYLFDLGYDITSTFNLDSALMLIEGGVRPDLIVSDIRMPGRNSVLDLIAQIEQGLAIPMIFVTGYSADILIREGLIGGKYPVLFKPCNIQNLAAAIRTELDKIAGFALAKQ